MRPTLRSAWLILQKDLRIELRTKDVTVMTALFAVLTVIVASLSFYLDQSRARVVAPGVLWVTIAFAGMLAMNRSWEREREHDVMRALLTSPASRAGIYLGKVAGNLIFMAAVEVVLVPLVGVFFHLDLGLDWLGFAALLVLGTLGFVAAGTLFGVMSVRTGMGGLMLSVVVFPLITPALLAAVVGTRELFGGAPSSEVLGWLRILAAFDVVFLAAGITLFDPLTSD